MARDLGLGRCYRSRCRAAIVEFWTFEHREGWPATTERCARGHVFRIVRALALFGSCVRCHSHMVAVRPVEINGRLWHEGECILGHFVTRRSEYGGP